MSTSISDGSISSQEKWKDQTLTVDLLNQLHAQKKITDEQYNEGISLLSPSYSWAQWTHSFFLGLGTLFVLVGIICFFAFNFVLLKVLLFLGEIILPLTL